MAVVIVIVMIVVMTVAEAMVLVFVAGVKVVFVVLAAPNLVDTATLVCTVVVVVSIKLAEA